MEGDWTLDIKESNQLQLATVGRPTEPSVLGISQVMMKDEGKYGYEAHPTEVGCLQPH